MKIVYPSSFFLKKNLIGKLFFSDWYRFNFIRFQNCDTFTENRKRNEHLIKWLFFFMFSFLIGSVC